MKITRGPIKKAVKICLYGPEGVGKSTFASQSPMPVFIDTEDSTVTMDVARFQRPSSWTMLMAQIDHVKQNPATCNTLVIDTGDWAEKLCVAHICSKAKIDGIESFGYGKGYVYLAEEFGRFLNKLQEVVELGINVIVTAHAEIKKVEQPEEIGGFDHWQLKLEKKTMPILKEWADILLFANYKIHVVNVDNQGCAKGKNKAHGGKRVMYTTHTPWWDAKNRHGLDSELPFDYSEIAHIIPDKTIPQKPVKPTETKPAEKVPSEPEKSAHKEEAINKGADVTAEITEAAKAESAAMAEAEAAEAEAADAVGPAKALHGVPKQLADLMIPNNVTVEEIQQAVASKGYYPEDAPIANYDPNFVSGVLVGAWGQVFDMIKEAREPEICEADLPRF